MSACEVVAVAPALCFVGFAGWPSSSPPNGRLVLLLDMLGRGGRLVSVPALPVVLGRHGTLWWCIAPSWWGVLRRCLAFLMLGRVPGGRKVLKIGTTAEKSFENWYDMRCPALEAALLKRYPEPMAHGPEACEPSHPLWPMARRPVSRHTRAEAVDTGCQRDIPVL